MPTTENKPSALPANDGSIGKNLMPDTSSPRTVEGDSGLTVETSFRSVLIATDTFEGTWWRLPGLLENAMDSRKLIALKVLQDHSNEPDPTTKN